MTTSHHIYTAPAKLASFIEQFRNHNTFFSFQFDGSEDDNIATIFHRHILTHCSDHHITLPQYSPAVSSSTSSNMNMAVTAENFPCLTWSLCSVGYSVNPRGTGPYQKLVPANLRYDEMTVRHLASTGFRKIKNPIQDRPLLVIRKFIYLA